MRYAAASPTKVHLPVDWLIEVPGQRDADAAPADKVPAGALARDIGPRTRDRFYVVLQDSKTVFWNGPLGLAEDPRFSPGTREVLAGLSTIPGFHVCAGGDSARVAADLDCEGAFQYVSTGGGAALEFVQGAELLIHFDLYGEAVAIPAGDKGSIVSRHAFRLDDEILQDLVKRRADVDLAVGVGRSVVQHKRRRVVADLRPAIVTTAGDLPSTADMEHLKKVWETIR
jgi:hypothetical protein